MKSIINSGTQIKAFCEDCNQFTAATYSYGPFEFDNGVTADNVLRALCDRCQNIVAVAQQSAAVLKEALDSKEKRSTMRLPQELLDFISVQLANAGAKPTSYELFLRAALVACHGKEDLLGELLRKVSDPVLKQPNNATLNIGFNLYLQTVIGALTRSSGIENTSDLLRRLVVLTEQPDLSDTVAAETTRLMMVCS